MQEDKTGYTNSHGIPVYKGEKTRQGWLQEINRGNTTPKGHTTYYIELIDNPQWFVDSSYTIHPDMKSHMGIFISNGKGGTHTLSCKPKLNTKISTKAELVAIYNAMAQILWTRHFLAAQGVQILITTIYKDKKSMILLSESSRMSNSKRTKHLNVRYFFLL